MLSDSLAEMVALDETPVPIAREVDEGTIPEDTSVPDRMPEEADVTLSVGRDAETLPEPDPVADGKIPDDERPEENSDATLDAMLLKSEVGIERGTDAVGWAEAVIEEERADSALDTRLETTLGRADSLGKSETADERRLDRSEITDGATDGRIPDADGDGVMESERGAVGFADPELGMMPVGNELSDGKTPVTSETTEERIEGKLTSSELADTPSEVGIAPEASLVGVADEDAESVPKAVVIPTTIPLEARSLEGKTPVGTTPLLGRMPDSMTELGVGSVPRRDESREPMRPADVEGCTIDSGGGKRPVEPTSGVGATSGVWAIDEGTLSTEPEDVGCKIDCSGGSPPVVPGTMKGPRKLDASEEGASAEGVADGVPERITSGIEPVDAACVGAVCSSEVAEVAGASDEASVGVG